MLNNYAINNSLKINACSGGIYKSCKESWFTRFHLNSNYADKILISNPAVKLDGYYDDISVVVLQMVICGDMEVIAELIKKEDYDKYFESEVEKDDR